MLNRWIHPVTKMFVFFLSLISLLISSSISVLSSADHKTPSSIRYEEEAPYFASYVGAPSIGKRIVNGKSISAKDVPYQVTLVKRRSIFGLYRYEPFCSGSLITNQHVLTAAHCVENNNPNFLLFLGIDDLGDKNRIISKPFSIHIHQRYAKDDKEDIAIIKLLTPINLDADSERVKIAKLSKQSPKYLMGGNIRVAGFGYTRYGRRISKILLSTNLSMIDNEICESKFEHYYERNLMICLTDNDNDTGTCGGDSGAPSVDVRSGEQVGLVSFGPDKVCGVKSVPEAHMNVYYYLDWIFDTIKSTS